MKRTVWQRRQVAYTNLLTRKGRYENLVMNASKEDLPELARKLDLMCREIAILEPRLRRS